MKPELMSHWSRLESLWWQLTFCLWAVVTWNTKRMSYSLIWWRAITWEGAAAFEGESYPPHPAGVQIGIWIHPKCVRMVPFLCHLNVSYSLRGTDRQNKVKCSPRKWFKPVCFKLCQWNNCMKTFQSLKGWFLAGTYKQWCLKHTITLPHGFAAVFEWTVVM